MAGSTRIWWDRDLDPGGRPIRPDVRSTGHEIWEQACRRTRAVVSDQAPAAELMENAVAQVSRYLDRIGAPLPSAKQGLLMTAFCRSLERYASKSARLELAGTSTELRTGSAEERWVAQSNARLDLEIILRRLSGRNAQILVLRAADYEWKGNRGSAGDFSGPGSEQLRVEPVPHNFLAMFLAELTKILGVDLRPPETVGSYHPTLQPAPFDPSLHFFGAHVESLRQGVFGEPVLPHARARSQPVQHRANRSGPSPQQHGDLLKRVCCDQVEKFLLLGLGPRPVGTP
jgi:hypothetical protein